MRASPPCASALSCPGPSPCSTSRSPTRRPPPSTPRPGAASAAATTRSATSSTRCSSRSASPRTTSSGPPRSAPATRRISRASWSGCAARRPRDRRREGRRRTSRPPCGEAPAGVREGARPQCRATKGGAPRRSAALRAVQGPAPQRMCRPDAVAVHAPTTYRSTTYRSTTRRSTWSRDRSSMPQHALERPTHAPHALRLLHHRPRARLPALAHRHASRGSRRPLPRCSRCSMRSACQPPGSARRRGRSVSGRDARHRGGGARAGVSRAHARALRRHRA
jgi:hypothetical protein